MTPTSRTKEIIFEDRLNVRTGYAGADHHAGMQVQRKSMRGSFISTRFKEEKKGIWQHPTQNRSYEQPPMKARCVSAITFSLRKEVIQPQVLLRLPCYDFTPIMNHTLGRCPPCGSARRLLVQSTFVM